MSDLDKGKCANPECSCMAGPDSKYCSPACEGAEETDMTEIGCGCGHEVCSGKLTS
jgi:hypothetical protein